MSEDGIVRSTASAGPFRSWAASHVGTVRSSNEDAFVNRPDLGLWAVADGAGGHQAGEVASARVVEALETLPPGLSASEMLAEIRQRVGEVHAWLLEEAARRGPDAVIATTLVVLVARDGHFACLWAGDSRAYLLREGMLTQISRDHSLVQALVDDGKLAADEAEGHPHANVVTRAVGAGGEGLELEKRSGPLLPGDRLLLCSDGLTKAVADPVIAGVLGVDEGEPAEQAIFVALLAGARDNVTVVTTQIVN